MLTNSQIKYYSSLKQKKHRTEERKFLIEGIHLVEECLKSPYEFECAMVDDDTAQDKFKHILPRLKKKNIPVHYLKENSFNKLKETENSQGIIGVIRKHEQALGDTSGFQLIVALENVSDPGNLGTIIRTSYWFGADAILLNPGCVEMYNSKVIRSTQGALFHTRILENAELTNTLNNLKKQGFIINIMTLDGDSRLQNIDGSMKSVFVFGNESKGISGSLKQQDFIKVRIEGYSNCESLNVSVSCGIALFQYRKYLLKSGI